MRPLLERFDEQIVWVAGLHVLGYPPTWANLYVQEVLPVLQLLTDKERLQMIINTQGTNSVDELDTGFSEPKPGKYHVIVNDVDDSQSKFDAIIVDFQVLDGTVPGQDGKTKRVFFNVDNDRGMERLTRFAMAAGLVAPNEKREVHFSDAVNRQLIVEFSTYVPKEGKNKGQPQLGLAFGGIWPLDHPDVSDVPRAKNPEPTETAGESGDGQQLTQPTGAASSDDKWDI